MTPAPLSSVTIVIVTYESADVIEGCLESIARHAASCRTLVVDNASRDDTRARASRFDFAHVLEMPGNEGFSCANNRGLREVTTEFALVLNPDARLTETTLPGLLAAAARSRDGAAFGPLTQHEDGRPQVSFGPDLGLLSEFAQRRLVTGVKSGNPAAIARWTALSATERRVDWISGSCMLLRIESLRAVGGFDERYFLYEEDADLCLRLRLAGYAVVFTPEARVIHALGTTMAKMSGRAREAYDRSHRLYYRLHRNALERFALEAMLFAKSLGRR